MPPFNIETIILFLNERLLENVYFNYGEVFYTPLFKSDFKEIGGRLDFLYRCVENNIYGDDEDGGIDLYGVIRDYQTMVRKEE